MSIFRNKKSKKSKDIPVQKKRVYIELQTTNDIKEFTEICNKVEADVSLSGKDVNGGEWHTDAKSLLCNIAIANILNDREKKKHAEEIADIIGNADWNTVYVECVEDIYNLISKFAK